MSIPRRFEVNIGGGIKVQTYALSAEAAEKWTRERYGEEIPIKVKGPLPIEDVEIEFARQAEAEAKERDRSAFENIRIREDRGFSEKELKIYDDRRQKTKNVYERRLKYRLDLERAALHERSSQSKAAEPWLL